MTILTPAAALAIALQCVPPSMADLMVGIAQHESGLNPNAIHHNPNDTTDAGLVQVNSSNWGWLGIHSLQDALDPCTNLAAGVKVLLARYNGNPPDAGKMLYAASVLDALSKNSDSKTSVRATSRQPELMSHPARVGRDLLSR